MTGTIAVVGLGAMGLPIACCLLRAGYAVRGADLKPANREGFTSKGGLAFAQAREAAQGADALVLLVVNSDQAEIILFGEAGAAAALKPGALVLLALTTSPRSAAALGARLAEHGLQMVDCPVSGGVKRAVTGKLTVLAAGPEAAISAARPYLSAFGKVFVVGPRHGQASIVKLLNQALCGIHIVAAAEVVALAERAGIDPQLAYDVISTSSGASRMFLDRVPKMISGDNSVTAAISILAKDMQLVSEFGTALEAQQPLASAACRVFLDATARGMSNLNDSEIVVLMREG